MKKELIYEGKAKKLFETDDADCVIVEYKDDATAFNGIKKAQIQDKGKLNNAISSLIYQHLEAKGIQTHYLKTLNDSEQLCRKAEMIPLEVIVRNVAAGSLSKRLALDEGLRLVKPVFELCYKSDALHDPFINDDHVIILGLATPEVLASLRKMALDINQILIQLFQACRIDLVDFKVEFGFYNGALILADEISPDSCRLWDMDSKEKLDKDRFRRDLGRVQESYQEILKRLEEIQ